MTNTNPKILTKLRDFVPLRPLTKSEALSIAERQATKLLELTGTTEPHVSETVISELPRIHVERISPWPTSGATDWVGGRWVIVINGAEPTVRQRFSLAHEFKHILDNRFIDIVYTGIPAHERQAFTEQICDYFAGCLLMPRSWLKTAYTQHQDLARLASIFHVSQAAMATRLSQTGIVAPTARCGKPPKDWSPKHLRQRTPTYQRTSTPQLVI